MLDTMQVFFWSALYCRVQFTRHLLCSNFYRLAQQLHSSSSMHHVLHTISISTVAKCVSHSPGFVQQTAMRNLVICSLLEYLHGVGSLESLTHVFLCFRISQSGKFISAVCELHCTGYYIALYLQRMPILQPEVSCQPIVLILITAWITTPSLPDQLSTGKHL